MVAASNGVEVSNGVKASSFEYKGWRFDSVSGPILSTCERGTLTDKLSATAASKGLPSIVPPLPEAIFGHSYLTMTHEASGRTFSFDAAGAIACWMRESAHKGSGGIRVTTASLPSWKKVADEQDLAMGASDYDWTFSTDYSGTTGAESPLSPTTEVEGAPAQWGVHTGSGLDMALLRRRDIPILHFVDLTLYEDDLGDNGESVVRLRMRVMPSCFLLLLRHALRVDGVLIRQHDTRVFHKFGSPHVLRDRRLGEARLAPLRKPVLLDEPAAATAAPWATTTPHRLAYEQQQASLRSASVPNEQQAAEKLATLPPKSESVEELLL
mmetsp:Transcript_24672/g.78890  ORF Transcript_24672/g.78890 Transcript_24672/m.78890 type:complete len:325 (+) Transcript_24672:58-1032(+)